MNRATAPEWPPLRHGWPKFATPGSTWRCWPRRAESLAHKAEKPATAEAGRAEGRALAVTY